jgi:hypothetical protein
LKPFNTFKPSKSLKALRAQERVPIPSVLAQEIVEDLEAALEQFREIAVELDVGGFFCLWRIAPMLASMLST